jgi:hypothetical protein
MKCLRFCIGIVFLTAVLLNAVSAQHETQLPFVDDVVPIAYEPEEAVPDYEPDKDPPPIWTLCGNPSKHLIIP